MITISLDVTLINKARLKAVTRKNGNVAKFLNLVLVPTPNSEYGDYIVKESCTKEEREAGLELPILGNGRNVERRAGGTNLKHTNPNDREEAVGSKSDDVPF